VAGQVFLQARAIAPSKGLHSFVAFGDPLTKGEDPRRFALLTDTRYESNLGYCEALRQHVAETGFRPLPEIRPAIETIAEKYHAGNDDVVLGEAFTDDAVLDRKDLNSYRIVFFGTHGVLAMRRSQKQAADIQKQIDQLDQENKQLEDRVKSLKTDPSSVEHIAREEMGLARPGEYIFKVPSRQNGAADSRQTPSSSPARP